MGSGSSTKTLPRLLWGGGIALVVVGAGGWFCLDRLAHSLLDHWRPGLEDQLSKSLGHPLRLGPYRGLRPWGIALGSTHVMAGAKDASTAAVQSVVLGIDPWATVLRGRPVAVLSLHGLQVDLRRNQQGQYWVPGAFGDQPPPKLDLAIRLENPAEVRIDPAKLQLAVSGHAGVQLDQASGDAALLVKLPGQGKLALRLKGGWRQPRFDLQTRIDQVRLASLQGLLPDSAPLSVDGQLGGSLNLAWKEGRSHCRGGVSLVNLAVQGGALREPLRSQQLKITCKDDRLQVPRSAWTWGRLQASVQGDVALHRSFDLHFNLHEPGGQGQVDAVLDGPWRQPRLRVDGRWPLPRNLAVQEPLHLALQLSGDWRNPSAIRAQLDRFNLQAPGLVVRASGAVYPNVVINSQQLELAGAAWERSPMVRQLLGTSGPVLGSLRLRGVTSSPELSLNLGQTTNPLLNAWSLQAKWTAADQQLRLTSFRSAELQATGSLPLTWKGAAAQAGDLKADLDLQGFPLSRLSPLVGTPMGGHLSAQGGLAGPLTALRPDLQLELVNPRAGTLRLMETWQGRFDGLAGGGGQLQVSSVSGAIGGRLDASLGRNWMPTNVSLHRRSGVLMLDGTPARYRWISKALPLDGLELGLPPTGRFEQLFGRLSGQGRLELQPLAMEGSFTLEEPGLLGMQLRQARLDATYHGRRYQVTGEFLPPDSGQIELKADGRLGGELNAEMEARGLSARWLTRGFRQFSALQREQPMAAGTASDLGTLLVNTFGGALDGQLKALQQLKQELALQQSKYKERSVFRPEDLRGQVEARLALQGADLAHLNLDLKATGHLWVEGDDIDHALQIEPFVATLSGPLQSGGGQFSLQHLPFTLLALIAPVPPSLLGRLGVSGQYRLRQGGPELTAELVLNNTTVGGHRLSFEKAQVQLSGKALLLDMALKDAEASESVLLTGQVPLEPSGALDVRLISKGDGLRFLTGFVDDRLIWKSGDANLRLILGGTLESPQANGFLVMNQGHFEIEKQRISDFNSSVVFDFNRLEVLSLQAKVGDKGLLKAQGGLGLFRPLMEAKPLSIALSESRIRLPMADVGVTADLKVGGALVRPRLSGSLEIGHGTIRPAPALFARETSASASASKAPATQPVAMQTLIEEKWDFKKPLVLLGPDVEADTSRSLRAAIPQLPALGFNNLRLRFGPKLAVSMGPLASFTTRGQLIVNGALDPSLRVQGVMEMLTGRISFFTTSFQLDPRVPNVAVFTPSAGLIPFVDVALVSRVSDSVSLGTESGALPNNVFETNGTGSLGSVGPMRLVKVMVTATGPADRLVGNLSLRSSPPMPEAQLLGLIGGNSLAGLSPAGGGAVLAAVLGQSLLTPVIGTLTDAFSQRLQFALYPTYMSPQTQDTEERVSGQVPPQLALVTELGVDLSERFNFSVLAAPNRNDIPPQGTLNYQITPNLSLSGSVDSQSTWQSQFQVFFRF